MNGIHYAHPEFGHVILVNGKWVNPGGPAEWAYGDATKIEKAKKEVDEANARIGFALASHGVEDPGQGTTVEIPPTLPGLCPEMRVWVAPSIPSRAVAEFFPKKPPEWVSRVAHSGVSKDCSAYVLGVDGRVAGAKRAKVGQGTICLVFDRWEETWAARTLARIVLPETGVRAILTYDDRPIGDGWLECTPIINNGAVAFRRWLYSGPQFGVWTPIASNWRKLDE